MQLILVNSQSSEQARHNKEMEKLVKEGGGSIPKSVTGKSLSNTLNKYGLEGNTKGIKGVVWGNGLYLEREGSGLFLDKCHC